MSQEEILLDEPQEIAKGIYWVGKRSSKELEVNVYLRVFEGNNQKINMLIDPGPSTDVEVISDKIQKVLGPDFKIHFAFINHQDPDVAMNAVYFQRHFPNMQIITTEDTWRLIRFFGLNSQRFIAVEKYKSKRISLKTGHKLIFIPTPYCHFRGACAIYDETEQILFSGDLFGGLSEKPDLYADESYWEGMKIFHQIYMPANIALKNAMDAIRRVNPEPNMIVPQHGSIIKGKLVTKFISQLEELDVGLDISAKNKLVIESYLSAINEILNTIKYKLTEQIVSDVLKTFKSDGSFPEIIIFNKDNKAVGFNISLQDAFQMFIDKLVVGRIGEDKQKIKNIILDALTKWNIAADMFIMDEESSADGNQEELIAGEPEAEEGNKPIGLKKIENLDVKKLLTYFVEQGGGSDYSQLLMFRMMLKIPPQVLKQHNVDSNDDLSKLGVISDPEFAGYIIKAVENVLGHPVPQNILNS